MKRPLLLDLFCCAGGAARGYYNAGFEVVGVDHKPQKHYPYQFIQADALEYLSKHSAEYDAIHASPPCQAFTALAALHRGRGTGYEEKHPDLIEPTRGLLKASGKPYIIENVVGAPLINPVMLCGTMFGLQTQCGAELRRHRLFESNILLLVPPHMQHGRRVIGIYGTGGAMEGRRTIGVYGHAQMLTDKRRTITVTGSTPQQNVVRNAVRKTFSVEQARRAMGIDWMTRSDLSQAIPPAYTELLGRQLICYCGSSNL